MPPDSGSATPPYGPADDGDPKGESTVSRIGASMPAPAPTVAVAAEDDPSMGVPDSLIWFDYSLLIHGPLNESLEGLLRPN